MHKHIAEKIYKTTRDSYQIIAKDFSATRNRQWPEVKDMVKKYIKDGDSILDIGAGNGRLVKTLAEEKDDIYYVGVDYAKNLIEEAKKNTPQKNGLKTDFLVADALEIDDLFEEKFDAVFMLASFNHFPSHEMRESVLQKVNGILKKEGLLIMTNWNLWQINNKKSIWRLKIFNKKAKNIPEEVEKQLKTKDLITYWQNKYPLYYYAFCKKDLKKALVKADFGVLKNDYIKNGQKAFFFNARNILSVAKKT